MILNSNAQFLVIVFVNVVLANMDSGETKEMAKQSFVSLLKNLIDVNQKRVEAMKKLYNLQDFIVTKNSLTKIHEYDMDADSAEDGNDQRAILTHVDMQSHLNVTLRRTYNTKIKSGKNLIFMLLNSMNIKTQNRNEENKRTRNKNRDKMDNIHAVYDNIENITVRSDESEYRNDNIENAESFRKNWRGACDKKAAKVCRSACVSAHKNGCMVYKCSRRAKKAFSKECKRSCKNKFLPNKYSDSDWERE